VGIELVLGPVVPARRDPPCATTGCFVLGEIQRQFLEGGKAGIEAGKSKPSTREQQLEDEVAELTQALGEAAVEIRVWKKSAEGRLGPSRPKR